MGGGITGEWWGGGAREGLPGGYRGWGRGMARGATAGAGPGRGGRGLMRGREEWDGLRRLGGGVVSASRGRGFSLEGAWTQP